MISFGKGNEEGERGEHFELLRHKAEALAQAA